MVARWGKRAAASLRAALQAPVRAAADVTIVGSPPTLTASFPGPSALASLAPRHLAASSSPWSLLQQRWSTGSGKGVPIASSVEFPKEYRSRLVAATAVVTHKYGPDVLHTPKSQSRMTPEPC